MLEHVLLEIVFPGATESPFPPSHYRLDAKQQLFGVKTSNARLIGLHIDYKIMLHFR